MDTNNDVRVTFLRVRSGRVWQGLFQLGDGNAAAILKEAWNTNSEIVSVEQAVR